MSNHQRSQDRSHRGRPGSANNSSMKMSSLRMPKSIMDKEMEPIDSASQSDISSVVEEGSSSSPNQNSGSQIHPVKK